MPRSERPNDDALAFGLMVRRLRRGRGWTLVQLGRYSGLNPKYLSVLERGGNVPSIDTVFRMAIVFSIDPCEFIREIQDFRAKMKPAPRDKEA